jgi:hypothetical protein
MTGRFYFYKMTVDGGGAPCVRGGLLSLAICKPRVRATASAGDVIIGMAGSRIDPRNGIIYVAKVERNLREGEYYRESQYRRRPDCIYRLRAGEWVQVANPFHTPVDIDRDLGRQREHTQVLISREFRYFGGRRFPVDWERYPALRKRVDRLLQGHRVRHSDEVARELDRLCREMFASSRKKVLGKPTHAARGRCNVEDGVELCTSQLPKRTAGRCA